MIEDTINDNTDPFFMAVLHQFPELFICTKAGIDMIVIHQVIFMIFPCCKDRIDINGIDTKLRQIIYVFCDPLYSSSKLSMNLFLSIVLLRFHSADKTVPGGEAVRKNIIDHGILYPLRRRHDICPVIKRKLVILRSVIHRFFGKPIPIIQALLVSVIQQEIIAESPVRIGKLHLPVVKFLRSGFHLHFLSGKQYRRQSAGPVPIIQSAGLQVTPPGTQADHYVFFIYPICILRHGDMQYCTSVHISSFLP